jgi:integrase
MSRRFNRHPLTEAERDARRQADRDRIEQAARDLLTTDGWQRWIKVRATKGLNNFDVLFVMSQVGHADSKMTTDVYAGCARASVRARRTTQRRASRARRRTRDGRHRQAAQMLASATRLIGDELFLVDLGGL